VEVFSWWVGPGEADGLAAMVKIFQAKYPNETFVNAAVAGGAGTNAQAVLATRLAAGDPPDSWQAHAGMATFAYQTAKEIQPLDDFYAKTGFGSALPKTLLPLISVDGHPYSVPVNIHRSNVMWYNPKVLSAAGVTLPSGGFASWSDFFAACDKVKTAGKTCLSLGPEGFTAMHLWENVMVGTIGAAKWSGLWTVPATTDWTGPDVKQGLANYAKVLTYTNSDASTLSDWQPASKLVADGDAAFNIMGDWAYGYFCQCGPQWARTEASHGLRLDPHTWHAGHLRLPVRQLRSAGGQQESRGHVGLADRCCFQGRPGSLQPAQGFDLLPHRLRSESIQRVFAECRQGLVQQYGRR